MVGLTRGKCQSRQALASIRPAALCRRNTVAVHEMVHEMDVKAATPTRHIGANLGIKLVWSVIAAEIAIDAVTLDICVAPCPLGWNSNGSGLDMKKRSIRARGLERDSEAGIRQIFRKSRSSSL